MKVGDYVKVVDAKDMPSIAYGDITKITARSGILIRFEGSDIYRNMQRFEALPILTEAPPKGSKVVKVEKSEGSCLCSDKSLGTVFTTTGGEGDTCLLYTSPSPRDRTRSRMPSSA